MVISEDSRQVVVDRTSPEIIDSTPDADAVDVPSATAVSITFDEPIHPDSVSPTTITLDLGVQNVAYTTELAADGLSVAIDYDRTAASTPYDVTLTVDGVTDLAGNPVDDEWSYEENRRIGNR